MQCKKIISNLALEKCCDDKALRFYLHWQKMKAQNFVQLFPIHWCVFVCACVCPAHASQEFTSVELSGLKWSGPFFKSISKQHLGVSALQQCEMCAKQAQLNFISNFPFSFWRRKIFGPCPLLISHCLTVSNWCVQSRAPHHHSSTSDKSLLSHLLLAETLWSFQDTSLRELTVPHFNSLKVNFTTM